MNRRAFVMSTLASAVGLSAAARLAAQKKTIQPDLSALADGKGFQLFNRSVSRFTDGAKNGARLSEAPGEGVAFLPGIEFGDGTIECDLKGKDVPQQSFLGIAFHGVDSTTYDAVYFRPFNFRATDSTRHSHAVEYVSHPQWTWQRLRTEHPGVYERAVVPEPDGDEWFHVRIVVERPKVSVFVNGRAEPSLVVDELSDRSHGSLGVWVGEGSPGYFANLRVTRAR